jgi:hypothetical protein
MFKSFLYKLSKFSPAAIIVVLVISFFWFLYASQDYRSYDKEIKHVEAIYKVNSDFKKYLVNNNYLSTPSITYASLDFDSIDYYFINRFLFNSGIEIELFTKYNAANTADLIQKITPDNWDAYDTSTYKSKGLSNIVDMYLENDGFISLYEKNKLESYHAPRQPITNEYLIKGAEVYSEHFLLSKIVKESNEKYGYLPLLHEDSINIALSTIILSEFPHISTYRESDAFSNPSRLTLELISSKYEEYKNEEIEFLYNKYKADHFFSELESEHIYNLLREYEINLSLASKISDYYDMAAINAIEKKFFQFKEVTIILKNHGYIPYSFKEQLDEIYLIEVPNFKIKSSDPMRDFFKPLKKEAIQNIKQHYTKNCESSLSAFNKSLEDNVFSEHDKQYVEQVYFDYCY